MSGKESQYRIRRLFIPLLAVFALVLAACSGSGETVEPGTGNGDNEDGAATAVSDDRVDACGEEPPILIYGNPPQEFWDKVIPAFQERVPGAEVETVDLGGQEMAQRYLSEASVGGERTADIFVESGPTTWLTLAEEGAIRDYEPQTDVTLPESVTLMPGVYALEMTPAIIIYNSTIFSEEEAPKSYADMVALTDEYTGQLTTYDISSTFGYGMYYTYVNNVDGAWDTLAQLLPATRPEDSAGTMGNKVGQGEYVAGYVVSGLLPSVFDDLGLEGLVGWNYTEDTVTFLPRGMALTEAGRSPNCAELFMDYLMSSEGQIAVCESGMHAFRGDIEESCEGRTVSAVEELVGPDNVWYVPYDEDLEAQQDEITARWRDLAEGS